MGRVSLGDHLAAAGNRPTGFDYARVVLCVSVIVAHSFGVSYGFNLYQPLPVSIRPFYSAILPAFFSLSGFLVAASLERSGGLTTFLGLRVLRIMPALAVEVLISALLLGPLLTTLTLGEYFEHPKFLAYFWNIVGHIHYILPGVFADNPAGRAVNGQLWTVPFELACYLALGALAIVGVAKRRLVFLILAVVLPSAAIFLYLTVLGGELYCKSAWQILGQVNGTALVLCFLAGVAAYQWRDRIPHSFGLFVASIAAFTVMLYLPFGRAFLAVPAAYATVYVGVLNPRKIWLIRGSDYSYGIFLYGFAVQQAVASLGPWTHHWYVNLALALPVTIVCAALSWHFVERPALGLRAARPWLQSKVDVACASVARLMRGGKSPDIVDPDLPRP